MVQPTEIDTKYMRRAIQIARLGLGWAAPNPSVGAVIVHKDKIIGEGYTSAYGGPHAEVNAIGAVLDKSLLKSATLYVTLEPCSHYGKTPPCADLITSHKIPRIVIGLKDPHDKVSGKGIAKLRANGCEVLVGVEKEQCYAHHKRFMTFHEKKRPYIILKWAQSLDFYLAPVPKQRDGIPQPYWITNVYSRQWVHKWRSQEQGILVGTQTVLDDNPKLNLRDWTGKNPTRIVLDRTLKIPKSNHVFDLKQPTILITENNTARTLPQNVRCLKVDFNDDLAKNICEALHEEQVQSILLEGGLRTLQTFIDAGLWDEARIFTGNVYFNGGIAAPKITGNITGFKNIKNDLLTILRHD